MKSHYIIKRPLITEKTTFMKEMGNYVAFEVDRRANKFQIRAAVEELFSVNVEEVKTMIMPGKVKRLGRSTGRSPKWKKAIIKIKEGQKIEFFEGV